MKIVNESVKKYSYYALLLVYLSINIYIFCNIYFYFEILFTLYFLMLTLFKIKKLCLILKNKFFKYIFKRKKVIITEINLFYLGLNSLKCKF